MFIYLFQYKGSTISTPVLIGVSFSVPIFIFILGPSVHGIQLLKKKNEPFKMKIMVLWILALSIHNLLQYMLASSSVQTKQEF